MPSDITTNPKPSRRLAAILAADIASYSALMGADEARTVQDLKAHQAVILPMIADHGGRVIDTAGDGILAEFASVVNAVECAVAVQKTMAERNAGIDPNRLMQFRIGINLGDVIHDEARVYGDGVNIAARLEAIAEPGGLCISDKVHQEIRTKSNLLFEDLGPQHLKNITESVRVYRIKPEALTTPQPPPRPALTLPDKPSIAVLPFTNLSGDPKEDYFSDGITEDIITELSRFSELFVIARNSSFQYKGKSPDIRQVGRELGVRYVLEGSIRRAGDRVRITAQLIDASTGANRWADKYDRKLEDVFAVQDEVARTIVAILAAHVNRAELERTLLKPPSTWRAYDYCLRAAEAYALFLATFAAAQLDQTRSLLTESIKNDPGYARAYAALSDTHLMAYVQPVDSDYLQPSALARATELARHSVQLDPNLPLAHIQLGAALAYQSRLEEATACLAKARTLNPNLSDWRLATPLVFSGEFGQAIAVAQSHMRLDPYYSPLVPLWAGFAHYLSKQYSDATLLLRECVARAPNMRSAHVWLAATYAQLGRDEEARLEIAEVLRIDPKCTIKSLPFNRLNAFKNAKDAEHFVDGLCRAGLPEG